MLDNLVQMIQDEESVSIISTELMLLRFQIIWSTYTISVGFFNGINIYALVPLENEFKIAYSSFQLISN